MNKCLECQTETTNPKFCNSSCAAKYNNKNRIVKCPNKDKTKICKCIKCDIDIEVNIRHNPKKVKCEICKSKKQINCNICGIEFCQNDICRNIKPPRLKNLINTFLIDSKFVGTVEFLNEVEFLRLKLTDCYLIDQLSTNDLAKIYSTSNENIRNILHWFNIPLRPNIGVSNKFKNGFHISWEGKEFYYRSSYELDYAKMLDANQISYEIEGLIFYIDPNHPQRRLVPDFYLPKTNEIIEIKSSYSYDKINMIERFNIFRKNGYYPKMILNKIEYVDENLFPENLIERKNT